MRLRAHEQRALRDYFVAKLPSGASAKLFGSRVDDEAHGGDVDICIVASVEAAPQLRHQLHRMQADLRELLGDQHVDVSIVEESMVPTNAFWRRALAQAIELVKAT